MGRPDEEPVTIFNRQFSINRGIQGLPIIPYLRGCLSRLLRREYHELLPCRI